MTVVDLPKKYLRLEHRERSNEVALIFEFAEPYEAAVRFDELAAAADTGELVLRVSMPVRGIRKTEPPKGWFRRLLRL